MTVLTLRYEAPQECGDDVAAAAAENAFAAVHQAQPAGIRCGLGRLPDGVTFVGVLELADGSTTRCPPSPPAPSSSSSWPGGWSASRRSPSRSRWSATTACSGDG